MPRHQEGTCNICGQHGKLSFEHTPAMSSGNNRKVLQTTVDKYWNHGPGKGLEAKGKQYQRGFGKYSLCESCNNKTGRWYVPYFADWCMQGLQFYDKTQGKASLLYFATIFPLPVIKQIVTMFLARHGDGIEFQKRLPLVRFVLNKEQRYLDPKWRFWVYYVAPGPLRDTPPCAVLDIVTGQMTMGMEFSFPPFGYMMTIDSVPKDRRLFEITHFARYAYDEMAPMTLTLEELPTHTYVMGDYRRFKEMDRKKDEPHVFITHDGQEGFPSGSHSQNGQP